MECKICGQECSDRFMDAYDIDTSSDGKITEDWVFIERCPSRCGLYMNYVCQTSHTNPSSPDDVPIIERLATRWVKNDPGTTDDERFLQHYFDDQQPSEGGEE